MVNDNSLTLPVIAIDFLRFGLDGDGIRTLILSSECPLHCRYCINNFCHDYPRNLTRFLSLEELYEEVAKHRLYYNASGGGITFGGGEPLLHFDFILEFCRRYADRLNINVETSLNLQLPQLKVLAQYVACFIVDIKDMNADIYRSYTGCSNDLVYENLNVLKDFSDKVIVRVPEIPDFNTRFEMAKSIDCLNAKGFHRIDRFRYSEVGTNYFKN